MVHERSLILRANEALERIAEIGAPLVESSITLSWPLARGGGQAPSTAALHIRRLEKDYAQQSAKAASKNDCRLTRLGISALHLANSISCILLSRTFRLCRLSSPLERGSTELRNFLRAIEKHVCRYWTLAVGEIRSSVQSA